MAICVVLKMNGDVSVLLFRFLFQSSSNSCSYNAAIFSEWINKRLLLFFVASFTVGFMLPVMRYLSSITQNLLCISAPPLSMTRFCISVSFSLSASMTTCRSTSSCFCSKKSLMFGSFNSYNAQCNVRSAWSANSIQYFVQFSIGQKWTSITPSSRMTDVIVDVTAPVGVVCVDWAGGWYVSYPLSIPSISSQPATTIARAIITTIIVRIFGWMSDKFICLPFIALAYGTRRCSSVARNAETVHHLLSVWHLPGCMAGLSGCA